jgi:hypothetical protein
MTTAWLLILLLLLPTPVLAYHRLQEAFGDRASDRHPSELSKDAIQYIVDACGLKWTPTMRGDRVLTACVSSNRRYCVLTRPYRCRGCSGGDGEAALTDSLGLRWTRAGDFAGDAVVSADGSVALFLWERLPFPRSPSLRLLILTSNGDTLVTRLWTSYPGRPYRSGDFDEVYDFSPDGRLLLYTMNTVLTPPTTHDEYNNTMLHCLTMADLAEHVEDLGAFRPGTLQVASDGASLIGHGGAYVGDESRGQVYWRIRYAPWSVKKHVKL